MKCRKDKSKKSILLGHLSAEAMEVVVKAKADTMMAELGEIHSYVEDEYETIDRYYNKCRSINRKEYMRIRMKYHDFYSNDTSDVRLALTFKALFGLDWTYDGYTFYHFNGVYWEPDQGNDQLVKDLSSDLAKVYQDMVIELKVKISKTEVDARKPLEARLDDLRKQVKTLQTSTSVMGVIRMLRTRIKNPYLKLDLSEYYFAFTNKIFDIRLNRTVDPEDVKYDYITRCAGYNHKKATAAELSEVWKILNVTFQDEAERDFYIYLLSTGIWGKTLQRIILANGTGGNGKGMIHGLVRAALGDYSYVMQSASLMGGKKTGPNVEIASLHLMRLGIAMEPDDKGNSSLSLATCKELTGGDEVNARMCQSNNTKTKLKLTLIMECNGRPKIDGPMNDAEARRIIDFKFRTCFKSKKKWDKLTDEQKASPLYVQADNRMDDKSNQHRLKYAVFEVLATYFKKFYEDGADIEQYMPDTVEDRTNEYLNQNDTIACFFEENCVRDPKSILIIKSDLLDLYRNSPYANHNARIGKFKEDIQSSLYMTEYYKDRLKRGINNAAMFEYSKITKDSVRSVIVGWALKDRFHDDDE
ncbi:hypothetical protein KIPB_010583 [Kipferlia bialata]|uniref:SF3 helicase domain-containing protein n=1 Tax=Kipferlia bialata TaxID=797122 RepID=A0A391NYP5_9EUKA|nr:hypothetical protein KIPB_010583 [Kipferlia bialata]|eukprot:g10583.t1